MKIGDFVIVAWWDAVGPAELEAGEALPPVLCETAGWVQRAEDAYLTVAGEKISDGTYRACTTIPRGMIDTVQRAGVAGV